MEMSQLEGIAGSLLNFEESIADELSAELLLGKNLNLEKARQAALNNDLATLASEIAEQAGNSAEFGAMNRIQQEAIAKAVGMNREELAKTLFTQEAMVGLTGEQAAKEEALLNARIAEVGLAQAQKEFAKDGIEGLKSQASQADRLLAIMDKLNEVLIALVEPMIPFMDILVDIFGLVGKIVKAMQPIFDFANLIGAGLGDLGGSLVSVLSGGEADFSASNKAGARFEENLGMGSYYTNLSKEGDGGNMFANGGVLKTRVDNITAGEAGPEVIAPYPQSGIKVDNKKMENLLGNIDKHLAGLNNAPLYTINRG